jgi:hypothetical protein
MPTQIAHQPSFRSGTLTIRIFSGDYIKCFPSRILVFALARWLMGYSPGFVSTRAWPRACPRRPHPRCHSKGPRHRASAAHVFFESREHATPALLVASLHRPRIRQERDFDRCPWWRSCQSGLELSRRLVSREPLEVFYTAGVSSLARSDVSRTSNLSLSAYLRTSQGLLGQDNMGNDLLIGRLDLTPVLDAHVCRFLVVSIRAT